MHAVFIEVNARESHIEEARTQLAERAVPLAKESDAVAGYWLAPVEGRGVSVTVFQTGEAAAAHAGKIAVGSQPAPNPEVTIRTVEVREVIASL